MTDADWPHEENSRATNKIRRSVTHMARRLRSLRSDRGISGSKLAILGWLFRTGRPITATDLAHLEGLQPQSLTRIIAELDEQGLIKRHQDESDRRQLLIEITKPGHDMLVVDAYNQNRWLEETMKAKLSKAEREILSVAADLLDILADETVREQTEVVAI
jgi:DNA-binding MarR family transcriptional regulator